MKLFYQLSLLFFLFSFLGWVMEVVLVSIEYRRLVNRGFLLGPWDTGAPGAMCFWLASSCAAAWNTSPAGIWKSSSTPAGGTIPKSP